MKIVFLHYTCGLIDRGSEISTQILADFLAKRKHKVYVYQLGQANGNEKYKVINIRLPFKPKTKENLSLLGKVLSRQYFNFNNILILIFSLLLLPSLINQKPDIIIPTNGFWQVLICKLVKLITRSKIVIIGRAGIGWHDKDNLRLKPDLFIGLSSKALLWSKKINKRVKSICLPNPIDINLFLKDNIKANLSLKKPVILTVAALTPYKNIDKLIKACWIIKNSSLLIVGQGELYKSLNQLAERYLKNRYLITDFKYREMASVYKAADLFVLLSDEREAFGRVFLEAMASGLPVVTTDTVSRRGIVGPKGIFVKTLKNKILVKAIKKGLAIGKSEIFKKQAEKFDIVIIGPKYEQAFLELLEE